MKYEILKSFRGSPNGSTVIDYICGEIVDLTESLAEVTIEEGWVRVHKKEKTKTRKRK
jgi:hypothetical protein